jgi:hypothetical protein
MSVVAKCVAIRCRATLDLRVPVRPLTIWGTVKTAKASISSLLARLTIGVRIAWSRTGSVHPEGGTRPSSRLPHAARATNARVVRVTAPVARRASPHRRSPCIENHRRVQWHDRSGIPSNPRPSAPSRSNPDSVYHWKLSAHRWSIYSYSPRDVTAPHFVQTATGTGLLSIMTTNSSAAGGEHQPPGRHHANGRSTCQPSRSRLARTDPRVGVPWRASRTGGLRKTPCSSEAALRHRRPRRGRGVRTRPAGRLAPASTAAHMGCSSVAKDGDPRNTMERNTMDLPSRSRYRRT